MKVEVESTTQFEEFRRVLRRRAWSILLPAILITSLGVTFAAVIPRKFVSSTRVMLRDLGSGEGGTSEGRVAEHTIRSPARIRSALTDLNWDEFNSLSKEGKQDYVERTLDNLDVNTPPMDRYATQQVVEAEFAHVDRFKAQSFLEQLMLRWRTEVIERRQNQVRQSYDDLKDARERIAGSMKSRGDQVGALRKAHGILPGPTDSTGREVPVAPQFQALEQAQEALLQLEERRDKKDLELRQLSEVRDRLELTVPLVSRQEGENLAATAAEIDKRVAEIEAIIVANGWLPAHSRYRAAQLEIARLRDQREGLMNNQSAPLLEEIEVENPLRVKADQAVAKAQAELEAVTEQHTSQADRVARLSIEVREIQEAIVRIDFLLADQAREGTVLEETESRLERVRQDLAQFDSPASNPFEVQDEASLPNKATEPNPLLISVLGLLVGLTVGLGVAIGREYSGSGFRSPGDLARSMALPVLGAVNTIMTRSVARRRAMQRLATGAVSALVVTFLGFVSYAWSMRPELLTQPMERAINQFRELFL